MVPLKYWGDNRVISLMIEVSRKLYMEAGRMKESSGFEAARTAVCGFPEPVDNIRQ